MSHLHRLFYESASAARSVNYQHVCLILLILFASARFSATGVKAQSVHPVLVSSNSAGTGTGNRSSGDSGAYSISADGRYIVYSSDASDIVPNDTNGWTDVFVRDMATGVTRLVSATPTGVSGNHSSNGGSISGNGRYVLFNSIASDLILNDTNGAADVYVRDLQTDTTRLVSRDRTNTKSGFGYSVAHAITPDGRYVLFYSAATDLVSVPRTEPLGNSVFVRDMQAGTTRLVSINREGSAWINRNANPIAITPDGRYVTFSSAATNITDDDPTDQNDVFVRDTLTDTTRLVSVATTGMSGNNSSSGGLISDDGRYIFFTSAATNLTTTPDTNSQADYFVRDTQAGTTTLISINKAGTASGRNTQNPNGFFSSLAVTPDGRYVAFTSQADDLVNNDQNGSNDDVFVRDLQTSTTRLVSVSLLGRSGNFGGRHPSISADGRYVAFESFATDLVNVPDFIGGLTSDVFVRDLQAGATVLGSINHDGTSTSNDSAFAPYISADGRRVVFYSRASNIVPNDVNGSDGKDVFALDPIFPPTSHLQFSAATYMAGEGEGHATISVTRTDSSLGAVSVNYATSDGTARAGSDYTAASGTLTFAAGDTTPKTFTIPIINDTLSEANETVNLSFNAPTGDAAVGAPALAVLTITDNDPQPALHVSNVNVPEGGTGATINAIFRVTLSAASGTAIRVTYGTADGTAAAGSDYEAAAGSLTFNPGETSKNVSVNVFGDTAEETDETFALKLMNPVGATTGGGGTGTITNDDPGTQFNVSGSVNDPSTGGVSGVTISLHLEQADTTLTTQTDANGNYMFINLPFGQNRVMVTASKAGLSFSPPSSGLVSSSSLSGNNTINFVSGTLYLANLTGAQVVPPTNSNGQGFGTLTLSLDEKKAFVDLNSGALSGFQTQAHIHSSTGPGANGPIQFTLPSGLVRNFLITMTPAQVQLLKAGQLYFDVHTNLFTGGEIRGQLLPPPPPAVQFSAASYGVEESAGQVILTIMRVGDISSALSVDYQTSDTDTFTVGCSDTVNNHGAAYARCDFATAVGTVSFAPGVTSKNIAIPIIDDAIVEVNENFQVRLTNAAGTALNTNSTTVVTISDNDQAGQSNPVVSSSAFFVRQQYLDFLSREPDLSGFNAWLDLLNGCPNAFNGPLTPSRCDRIYVSGEGFFRSQEFQLKGFYVFRFYKLAFGRLPEYSEIVSDMSFVAGQTPQEVYQRKAQLATNFTERQEFKTAYGGLPNSDYVFALLARSGLPQITTPDPADPDGTVKVMLTGAELTRRLDAGTLTRAQVFRSIADSDHFAAAESNHAFVGMQYYGYLRRKPDQDGFNAWLSVLQAGDVRTMVNGFLNSTEYKLRFGRP